MGFKLLTEEQYNKAIDSGFTHDQIIGFEKQRKSRNEDIGQIASEAGKKTLESAGVATNTALLGIPGIISQASTGGKFTGQLSPMITGGTNIFEGKDLSGMDKVMAEGAGMIAPVGEGISLASKTLPKVLKPITDTFHNEEFIKGQAKNVQNIAKGMSDALHNLYGSFYKEQGLSNIVLDSSKADEILLTHNIPKTILKEVDEKIGKIDTVGKAHEARQLIDSKLSDSAYLDNKGEFSPIEAKKAVRKDFKDLMRATTKPVNPEATALLEDLDKYAYEHIYPRIDKFQKMVGKGVLNSQYPKTSSVLSLMKGGLSKAPDVDIMLDTPDKIKGLGKYLDTPEFKQDLQKTLESSQDFVKKMKSFQGREKLKEITGLGAVETGVAVAIKKLFHL